MTFIELFLLGILVAIAVGGMSIPYLVWRVISDAKKNKRPLPRTVAFDSDDLGLSNRYLHSLKSFRLSIRAMVYSESADSKGYYHAVIVVNYRPNARFEVYDFLTNYVKLQNVRITDETIRECGMKQIVEFTYRFTGME